MGQLTRRAHTLFDVYFICLLFFAPILFGIEGTPRLILWLLCVAHFFVTILSDTPYGAGLLTFPLHGAIELVVGAILPFLPVIFGFDGEPNTRHVYRGLSFGILVLWFLTDYRFRTGAWTKEAHVDTGVDVTAENLRRVH